MHGRKEIRLKKYDYTSDGYYFVTVVSKLRQDIFIGKEKLIELQLLELTTTITGLNLDYYVVMPNHVHIILALKQSKLHLGEIIRRFKAKVSHILNVPVWQANYYEHVIRNEIALNRIREYIINNPLAFVLKFEQFYK